MDYLNMPIGLFVSIWVAICEVNRRRAEEMKRIRNGESLGSLDLRPVEQLGFKNAAGAKTLAKYYNQAEGTKLPWTYKDCTDRRDEALRRNRIVGKFLEMMYEAWEVIKKDGESAITGGQRG